MTTDSTLFEFESSNINDVGLSQFNVIVHWNDTAGVPHSITNDYGIDVFYAQFSPPSNVSSTFDGT